MRFVPSKTPEQQSCLMLHRTRHMFIRQQTALINSIRAHLAEFGIVAPVGRRGVTELLRVVADPNDKRAPDVARACLAALGAQLLSLKEQILEFDRMILAWHRSNQTSKRLHCWCSAKDDRAAKVALDGSHRCIGFAGGVSRVERSNLPCRGSLPLRRCQCVGTTIPDGVNVCPARC